MVSDFANLMKAVCASPADDLPRLVLADWLEENGQPERAEFIRLQCELEKVREYGGGHCPGCLVAGGELHADGCWVKAGRKRESDLVDAHIRVWLDVAVPGAVMSHWSPHNTVPYFVLPARPSDPVRAVNVERVTRGFWTGVACELDTWFGFWDVVEVTRPGELVRRYQKTLFNPGIGGTLVSSQPIDWVTITDRHPGEYGDTREWYFVRWTPQVTHDIHTLPPEVFDRIPGEVHVNQLGTHTKHFPNSGMANAALSAACIDWANSPTG